MSKKVKTRHKKNKLPKKDLIKRWEHFEYVSKTGISVRFDPRSSDNLHFTIMDCFGRMVEFKKSQFLGLVDCLNKIVESEKI